MNRFLIFLLACLTLLLGASFALAEGIVAEGYRSPHGWQSQYAVDPADGSCWAISGTSVVHLDAAANLVCQYTHLQRPGALALNTVDGSCWISDCCGREVVHVSREGTELWRGRYWGGSLSVDQRDGSLWFSALAMSDDFVHEPYMLVHISATGQELSTLTTIARPSRVAVSPLDGSLWVYDVGNPPTTPPHARLVHLSGDGTVLGEWPTFGYSLAVNPTDGSCWAGGADAGVIHLSASNKVLSTLPSYWLPTDLAVNPADGSCWVQFIASDPLYCRQQILVLVAADGAEVRRLEPPQLGPPYSLAVSPVDGSLWRNSDSGWAHLAANGTVLQQDRGLQRPYGVAVNSADGSYWIGGASECGAGNQVPWVAHYDALGNELWRKTGFYSTDDLAPDPADGSIWIAHYGGIVHLAADGTQLPFSATFGANGPSDVIVDPRDRSIWVCDTGQVNHYGRDGTVLGTITYDGLLSRCELAPDGSLWALAFHDSFPEPNPGGRLVHIASDGTCTNIDGILQLQSFSVNPLDGSVWTSDFGVYESSEGVLPPHRLTHLAVDGTVLWQGGQGYDANEVVVDPRNGSCWVAGDGGAICLLSPTAEELGRTERTNYVVLSATVNPADGTLWVLDESSQLCRVASSGPFTDVAATSWAAPAVSACAAADVVKGYWDGSYHPAEQVTRDQMAVYIARALCGSDDAVPEGPAAPSFEDVAPDFWAYKQIEYCKAQRIVQGYEGDYQPGVALDRAQMATFLARAIVPFADRPDLTSYTAPSTPSFPDVAPEFWAYRAIEYVRLQYVAAGYPDGKFRPEYGCTRDQMAVFTARAFHLLR